MYYFNCWYKYDYFKHGYCVDIEVNLVNNIDLIKMVNTNSVFHLCLLLIYQHIIYKQTFDWT